MKAWFARLAALVFLLIASTASAQNTYSAYIDSDGNASTGCTIALPGGTFVGAEWRVQATATTGGNPQVTSVTLAQCGGGVFGAGTAIGGNYPVGLNDGVSASDVVEFSAPKGTILGSGSYAAPLGFVAESASGSDVMFAVDGGGGSAIVLGMVAPTPALGAAAMVLLALLLLLVARRTGRGRLYSRVLGLSLIAICSIAVAATFIDDGLVGDWNGISPIATDPAGDPSNASPDIDLRAAFVAVDGGWIHFRLDVTDMQTQSPAITSANTTTFVIGAAGSFMVTASGVPTPALTMNCTPSLPAGVTFTDNGNGTGTLAGTPLAGSTGNYACTVGADNAIPPAASQNFSFVVANAATNTTVASNINPSLYGQSVTFTATVTVTPPGSGTPTGNVTFFDGATMLGTGNLNGGGQATLVSTTLDVAAHSITAQYSGDADFASSTSAALNQVVNQAATATALVSDINPSVFGQSVTLTATVTVGAPGAGTPTGTITFKDGASTLGTGTLAGSIATLSTSTLGVGTHSITATYPGDANFQSSISSSLSQVVNQASQTITYTSTAPAAAIVGGATYVVTATGGASGNPVTFTIDASASAVCSIAGATVSFTSVGTCVIDANQTGNTNYLAAPQVQQSFTVGQGSQIITFTSTAPANAVVGGATYNVTATGGASGNPVTFTIDASATAICSIAGSTVSFAASGTCVINANQAGNVNYTAAPQAQQSFAVGKNNQTITYTSTAPGAAVVDGTTYTVTASGGASGNPVTFTIDATAASVCSIAGSTVSFTTVGTCVIDANQAGNANFNAAPQVQQSFAVGKGAQTISFTSSAPAGAAVGGATYSVTATATSGLPVTFTIDAAAASVCSIAGSSVSFNAAGTCIIDANQAGNANYNAATQAQQSFAVAKGAQTITFTSSPPLTPTVGGATYAVGATATSGLSVAFTIDASAGSVCSIAGATVSFIGNGTCVIDANQAGNANYDPAAQVQQSFAVKSNQTISFTSTAPSMATVGGATYAVSAIATSGLGVTFTIDASAAGVCAVVGSTVSFTGNGTCVIDANQAGDGSYYAAPQVQQSFIVKSAQTIAFTSTAPNPGLYLGPTYSVTASGGGSGNPVTFTIDATASTVCSISGTTVSFIGTGICVIDANQAGNGSYYPATQVQQSFGVAPNPGDDAYSALGNVLVDSSTGTPFATIDNDNFPGGTTISTFDATSTNGGAVTMTTSGANMGRFTYNPPVGYTGADTFTYTLSSNGQTRAGTVTFTISGKIWFIDNSAGACASSCNGRATNPYTNTTNFQTDNTGAALKPSANDGIFLYSGSGNYTGAITLLSGQKLIGQGAAGSLATLAGVTVQNGQALPSAGGARPTIAVGGGTGVTLNSGNSVLGLNVINTNGSGISGSAVGTLTLADFDVTATGGTALGLTTSGTVTATGTDNNLSATTGTALSVANVTIAAGGMTFKRISASDAAKGIALNTTGMAAGNGGLSVTGTGTTAGSGGTIQNISARGGEFIATKALVLKNMNFTNANTTDGGTCTDLSTAACNAAIYLNGVTGVTLDRLAVSGTTAQEAINGISVSTFALTNSTLTNCGTSGTVEEGCIKMRELTGTSSISDSDLSFPGADVVEIVNSVGPALTLNVSNATFRDSQSSAVGNTGLQARSQGTASMVLNVTNSSFLRIRTVGLQATAINNARNDVDVSNSTFDTGPGTMIGLDLDADNTGTLVFNIQNNPRIWSSNGPAINVFGDTSATINGRIINNTDVRVLAHVGGNVGSGIRANINKDATARLEVKNNVVNVGSDDAGIDLSAIGKTAANPGGASNTLDATVTGNTVTIGSTSSYGLILLDATNAGDTNALCANVGTNAITRDPSSIFSFRARVPSVNGFFRMQNFVTNAEATWNGNGNTPLSAGGSEVSFGGSGTFAACTAVLPTNPVLN